MVNNILITTSTNVLINYIYIQHAFCVYYCLCFELQIVLSVETWQVQDFLLRFDLGPPEGFKDDDHEAEDDFSAVASVGQPGQHEVEVKLGRLVIFWEKTND